MPSDNKMTQGSAAQIQSTQVCHSLPSRSFRPTYHDTSHAHPTNEQFRQRAVKTCPPAASQPALNRLVIRMRMQLLEMRELPLEDRVVERRVGRLQAVRVVGSKGDFCDRSDRIVVRWCELQWGCGWDDLAGTRSVRVGRWHPANTMTISPILQRFHFDCIVCSVIVKDINCSSHRVYKRSFFFSIGSIFPAVVQGRS